MTLFTKIIRGEIPSVKVAENETCLAFMDINPLKEGHLLVVPKVEVDEFYELEDRDLTDLILFAKRLSIAMKKTFNARIGMWMEGLEVPHAHIHLMPIESGRDFIFNYPRLKLSQDELREIANRIILNL
jgi:histidine triad (HIT) family protein